MTRSRTSLSRTESNVLARHRRGRNLAMLLVLLGLSGLFYLITLVKLAHQIP